MPNTDGGIDMDYEWRGNARLIGNWYLTLYIVTFALVGQVGFSQMSLSTYGIAALLGVPFVLILVDMALCVIYTNRIRRVDPKWSLGDAYFGGAPLSMLRKNAREAKTKGAHHANAVKQIEALATALPGVAETDEYKGFLERGDIIGAERFAEKERKRRASQARSSERRFRRVARLDQERVGLFREGVRLGIGEVEMEEALGRGPGEAKELIAGQKRREIIREKARRLGCELRVDEELKFSEETARVILVVVQALLDNAKEHDVTDEVRELIAKNDIPGAQGVIERKDRAVRLQLQRDFLEHEILKAPEERREALREQAKALEQHSISSREHRLAYYALIRAIQGEDAAA